MRGAKSRGMRQMALVLGLLLAALLLAACGGDDAGADDQADNRSPDVGEAAPDNAAVAVDDQAGNAPDADNDPALQATPAEPLAATVNGQPITLAAFERELERFTLGMAMEPADQAAFEATVLDAMIEQVVIAQAGVDLGIVVVDADVDAELAVQAELAQANGGTLEEIVAAQLYTMDEYRAMLHTLLVVQQVRDEVTRDVPAAALQVHSRHILVADEATAQNLIAQIQGGADFAQLATQHSLDESSAAVGGDLGWVAEGVLFQPEVEAAIFSLPPGQLAPEPVQSNLGYHVVQTLERVEDRPLSQAALAERKQQVFLDWLAAQVAAADIVWYAGVAN